MNAVAIDTSVLLAILKGEPKGEIWLECLQSAAESATLLVSSVVFHAPCVPLSLLPLQLHHRGRAAIRKITIGNFSSVRARAVR